MYFFIEDGDLLEKHNTIWDKVSADIKQKFDSEPVYNKIFLKTKIKSHGDEVSDFYDKKIPKVDSNHTCLEVINLDSALNKDGNYYPQVFLKECKEVIRHIIDELEISSRKIILLTIQSFVKGTIFAKNTLKQRFPLSLKFAHPSSARIQILKSNLSIADMLYNGHLVIADTVLRNRPNRGQTLIEKPLYRGHFYSGHLL